MCWYELLTGESHKNRVLFISVFIVFINLKIPKILSFSVKILNVRKTVIRGGIVTDRGRLLVWIEFRLKTLVKLSWKLWSVSEKVLIGKLKLLNLFLYIFLKLLMFLEVWFLMFFRMKQSLIQEVRRGKGKLLFLSYMLTMHGKFYPCWSKNLQSKDW